MNANRRKLLEDPGPQLPPQFLWLSPLLLIFFLPLWFYWPADLRWHFEFSHEVPFYFPLLLAEAPVATSPGSLIINIHADGSVSASDRIAEPASSSDLPLLRAHLRSLGPYIRAGGTILIRPAAEVRHQRIIDVLSALAGAGSTRYLFL